MAMYQVETALPVHPKYYQEHDHLTFDEQGAEWKKGAGWEVYPCACWFAGRMEDSEITRDEVLHPEEWDKGWQALYDCRHDC